MRRRTLVLLADTMLVAAQLEVLDKVLDVASFFVCGEICKMTGFVRFKMETSWNMTSLSRISI